MARQKGQRGELKRIGKDKWWCRWYVYNETGHRLPRTKTFSGFLTKFEAQKYLNGLIAEAAIVKRQPHASTFADLWEIYTCSKVKWSTANRKAVKSVFSRCVLPKIGYQAIASLTPHPLQAVLNQMAEANFSKSAIQKARTYMKAALEYAVDEDLIVKNPARGKKLELPPTKKSCGRFYTLEQVHRLLSAAARGEHLILRLFLVGGFRPGELFALRNDDVIPGAVHVNEAVKEVEKGEKRFGAPKVPSAIGDVPIPDDLERELRGWMRKGPADQFLFVGRRTKPLRQGNYLKRVLKPLAQSVGIPDFTYQALRRTCATWFRNDLKSAQAQLRHTTLDTTIKHYAKTIAEDHRRAVEVLDELFRPKPEGQLEVMEAEGSVQ